MNTPQWVQEELDQHMAAVRRAHPDTPEPQGVCWPKCPYFCWPNCKCIAVWKCQHSELKPLEKKQ